MTARPPDEPRDILKAALEEIAAAAPTCSEDADEVWANRLWAGRFRDLQRIARRALAAAAKA